MSIRVVPQKLFEKLLSLLITIIGSQQGQRLFFFSPQGMRGRSQ